MSPAHTRAAALLLGALALTGCPDRERPSMYVTAGVQAEHIRALGSLFSVIILGVFVLVVGALVWGLVRARRRESTLTQLEAEALPADAAARALGPLDAERERRFLRAVALCTLVTVVLLFVMLVASVATGRALAQGLEHRETVTINVIGHQWWWELRYLDPLPSNQFTTANELHIPVGQPVLLKLNSQDVIHSFWVPALHGKRDLIPGQENSLVLQADRPGIYLGQCAEFCGLQHAHMGLRVVAEPPEQFQAWLQAQRQPAVQPTGEQEKLGQQVFLQGPCVMCHAVAGTSAAASVGPDLTHFASRQRLGADTLDNTPGALAGWIANPHGIKPGVWMPSVSLPPEDLQALVAYLRSLK
jgi:cytochrome c oxidase subunit 2